MDQCIDIRKIFVEIFKDYIERPNVYEDEFGKKISSLLPLIHLSTDYKKEKNIKNNLKNLLQMN